MKFSTLLVEVTPLWPSVIDLSDGHLVGDAAGYFPQLSGAWNAAEEQGATLPELHQLMVWAIFGALHEKACQDFAQGKQTIALENCPSILIESHFASNLFDPEAGYNQFWPLYVNDLISGDTPNRAENLGTKKS